MSLAWTAAALVLLVAFFVAFIQRTNRRYAQAWPPLAALVDGTAKGHKLEGTWRGSPLRARVITATDETSTTCFFAVDWGGREVREPIPDAFALPAPERFQELLEELGKDTVSPVTPPI